MSGMIASLRGERNATSSDRFSQILRTDEPFSRHWIIMNESSNADASPYKGRTVVGPSWPPTLAEYDYVRTLPNTAWAWEFLRRNPDYQRAYRLNAGRCGYFYQHRSGITLCRLRRRCRKAEAWGLCSFHRSLRARSYCTCLLVS